MILVDTKNCEKGSRLVQIKGNPIDLCTELVTLLSAFSEDPKLDFLLKEALVIYKRPGIEDLLKNRVIKESKGLQ